MYLLYCPPNYKLLKWNCWKFWSREMKYHHSSVVESKSFHHSWLGFASSLVMKWFWFNSRLVMIFHFSTPEFSAIVHFLQFQKWPKINFWTGKKFKTAKNNAISIHRNFMKKNWFFFYFTSFFCLDFFTWLIH